MHPLADAVVDVALAEVAVHGVLHRVLDVLEDEFLDAATLEHVLAHPVEHAALHVHRFVVLEDILADEEVSLLDLPLRANDRLGEHRVLDGVALLHAQLAEHLEGGRSGEHLHEVVLEAQEDAARPHVALAAASAPELVVDPPRLVPLGGDDVQTAEVLDAPVQTEAMQQAGARFVERVHEPWLVHRRRLVLADPRQVRDPLPEQRQPDVLVGHRRHLALLHVELLRGKRPVDGRDDLLLVHVRGDFLRADTAAFPVVDQLLGADGTELDVRSATGHVRRDHDGAEFTRVGDDVGFALVLLGVEDLVLDAVLALEHVLELLGLLHACGPDKNGPPHVVEGLDLVHDRVPLVLGRQEHDVLVIDADHRDVGRDDDDIELVDLVQLRCLRVGCPGHARQPVVQLEEVLDRDRGHRLRFILDRHAFLGLHGLVQPVRPLPADHLAARALVNDDDGHRAVLVGRHDVVPIALVHRVGADRLLQQVRDVDVVADVERTDAGGLLRLVDAVVGERGPFLVELNLVVLGEAVPRALDIGQPILGRLHLLLERGDLLLGTGVADIALEAGDLNEAGLHAAVGGLPLLLFLDEVPRELVRHVVPR